MKKVYEIPEAEALHITLEWGVLQVHGTDEPIIWGKNSKETEEVD